MTTIYWYTKDPLSSLRDNPLFSSVEEVILNNGVEVEISPRQSAPAQGQLDIYRKVTMNVHEDSSSYRYRALMQKTVLMLKFSLPEFVEIPVGAWVEFRGEKYYLHCPEDLKKQGTRNIEYTVNLYSREASMEDYKLRNTVDRRLKFSMCAKPHEFLQLIVDNLKERDGSVWRVGSYIDGNEKTVEFNHTNILEALQSVANTFETEWEISTNNTGTIYSISLGKVEYHKTEPYPLSYGKGNGFVPGVGRTSKVDEKPIKRLYVQGGERNIDRSKNVPSLYSGNAPQDTDITSATLLLPIGQSLRYDGEHFEGETGFDETEARTYTVDDDGYSIQRTDKDSEAVKEDSLDCSECYPKRVGNCMVVEEVDRRNHFWDFVDSSIPDTLNYNDYQIGEEKMTVVFQSGMLSGKEFEVEYIHDDKRFKIVPQEIDGITMPDYDSGYFPKGQQGELGNEDYYPGDEYAVFHCMLPDDYICNNIDKSGGAWDMFREAVKYMYDHEDQKFTFSGVLQGLWAKRNWESIKDYMKVGAYILFTDPQFAPEGEKIRITGVKEMLTDPYAPTIELSNSVGGASTVSSQLKEIEKTEVIVDDAKRDIIQFTKRRFRDAVETMSMLQGAVDGFSDAVNPITIQTMAALIGDESLQFQFVIGVNIGHRISYNVSPPNIVYDCDTCILNIPARILQHLTLPKQGEEKVLTSQSNRQASDYPMWSLPAWNSEPLNGETVGRCFLYAKCEVDGASGRYVLSETTHKMRETERGVQYYYFLIGMLSSDIEGERSFVSVYGFTEILPGRITTDRLVSTDGESWLSLVDGAMKLGDALSYNEDGLKELRLKFLAAENSRLGGWVIRDGKFYSEDGGCHMDGASGDIITTGLVLKRMIHINSSNVNDYITEVIIGEGGESFRYYTFDFFKAGSLIMIDELPRINGVVPVCIMPTLYSNHPYTDEQKANFRAYIGSTIVIYNNSNEYVSMTGNITSDESVPGASISIAPGYMAKMECRVRIVNGYEETYWLTAMGRFR